MPRHLFSQSFLILDPMRNSSNFEASHELDPVLNAFVLAGR